MAYVAGKKNQVPRGLQKKRVDDRVNLRLTAEATGFLERSAGKPFFLYFTPVAAHNPGNAESAVPGREASRTIR